MPEGRDREEVLVARSVQDHHTVWYNCTVIIVCVCVSEHVLH